MLLIAGCNAQAAAMAAERRARDDQRCGCGDHGTAVQYDDNQGIVELELDPQPPPPALPTAELGPRPQSSCPGPATIAAQLSSKKQSASTVSAPNKRARRLHGRAQDGDVAQQLQPQRVARPSTPSNLLSPLHDATQTFHHGQSSCAKPECSAVSDGEVDPVDLTMSDGENTEDIAGPVARQDTLQVREEDRVSPGNGLPGAPIGICKDLKATSTTHPGSVTDPGQHCGPVGSASSCAKLRSMDKNRQHRERAEGQWETNDEHQSCSPRHDTSGSGQSDHSRCHQPSKAASGGEGELAADRQQSLCTPPDSAAHPGACTTATTETTACNQALVDPVASSPRQASPRTPTCEVECDEGPSPLSRSACKQKAPWTSPSRGPHQVGLLDGLLLSLIWSS